MKPTIQDMLKFVDYGIDVQQSSADLTIIPEETKKYYLKEVAMLKAIRSTLQAVGKWQEKADNLLMYFVGCYDVFEKLAKDIRNFGEEGK